ncbi:MAG: type II toxin-antitoxin system MqsA family antitoxin [Caldilineaceae bacterium]
MQHEHCEYCEGELAQRQVLARFRYKGATIYIEGVPAWVCRQCGDQYYDAPVYKQMERIAQQREQIHRRISFPLAEFTMALPT